MEQRRRNLASCVLLSNTSASLRWPWRWRRRRRPQVSGGLWSAVPRGASRGPRILRFPSVAAAGPWRPAVPRGATGPWRAPRGPARAPSPPMPTAHPWAEAAAAAAAAGHRREIPSHAIAEILPSLHSLPSFVSPPGHRRAATAVPARRRCTLAAPASGGGALQRRPCSSPCMDPAGRLGPDPGPRPPRRC